MKVFNIRLPFYLLLLLFCCNGHAQLKKELLGFNQFISEFQKNKLTDSANNISTLTPANHFQASITALEAKEFELSIFYYFTYQTLQHLQTRSFEIDYSDSKLLKNSSKINQKSAAKLLLGLKLKNKVSIWNRHSYLQSKLQKLVLDDPQLINTALSLYEKWQPNLENLAPQNMPSNKRLNQDEIHVAFSSMKSELNEGMENFIKLMSIPSYKEAKVKSVEYSNLSAELRNKGNNLDGAKSIEFSNAQRKLEAIEMDNLLFYQPNWGIWF